MYGESQQTNFYPYQLPSRDTVTLNLDLHPRGLGGDNSWGDKPHGEFLITPAAPLSYSYRLKIINHGDDLSALGRAVGK